MSMNDQIDVEFIAERLRLLGIEADRLGDLGHLLAIRDGLQSLPRQRRREARALRADFRIAGLAHREAVRVALPEATVQVSSLITHRTGL